MPWFRFGYVQRFEQLKVCDMVSIREHLWLCSNKAKANKVTLAVTADRCNFLMHPSALYVKMEDICSPSVPHLSDSHHSNMIMHHHMNFRLYLHGKLAAYDSVFTLCAMDHWKPSLYKCVTSYIKVVFSFSLKLHPPAPHRQEPNEILLVCSWTVKRSPILLNVCRTCLM